MAIDFGSCHTRVPEMHPVGDDGRGARNGGERRERKSTHERITRLAYFHPRGARQVGGGGGWKVLGGVWFWVVVLLLGGSGPGFAQGNRVALVVGNNAYPQAPLRNAVRDAQGMGELLGKLGFDAEVAIDTSLRQLDEAIDRFVKRLDRGDVGLFFYSGHGIQVAGANYMIPVDFDASSEKDAKYEAYSMDRIRERMDERGARLSILILDACRNNPFRGQKSLGRGLAVMQGGRGTFIAFATSPGKTASDGRGGKNGLFTEQLLETLATPGLTIHEVFREVRRKVDRVSGGDQLPWISESVIGDFYFAPARKPDVTPAASSTSSENREALAKLRVFCTEPQCRILLDGREVGMTQDGQYLTISVPAGRRTFEVSKSGFFGHRETLLLLPESMQSVIAALEPRLPASPPPSPAPVSTEASSAGSSAAEEHPTPLVASLLETAAPTKIPTKRPSPRAEGGLRPSPRIAVSENQPESGSIRVVRLPGDVDLELLWVPGGIYEIGCSKGDSECEKPETPSHKVMLDGFWIGKTEVTQRQWKAVMKSNPSYFKGDELPVEQVSWNDLQEFLLKAGHNLQLPTEAEWERAARGGTLGPRYWRLGQIGWSNWNGTRPVRTKKPNAYGLYDVLGNVWEWCEDVYQKEIYQERGEETVNPLVEGNAAASRVIRGGSWYGADSLRVSRRGWRSPGKRDYRVGFRVAQPGE